VPGNLSVYGVGLKGVTVDKDPIELEDGELVQAQNATTDSIGAKGALRKRDGIALFTKSGAMAGPVRGLIGLPLPDLSKNARTFYIGLDDFGNPTTGNWRTSTDGATWASSSPFTAPATWNNSFGTPSGAGNPKQQFGPACPRIPLNNVLYFPGNDYTVNTGQPTLRSWDGTNDTLLSKVPKNPYTTVDNSNQTLTVLSIVPYDSHTLLVSTYDNSNRTRVLTLDTNTGVLTHLGPQTDLNGNGQTLALVPIVYQGRVFFGSANLSGGASSKVWYTRPGDTIWTLDNGSAGLTSVGYTVGAAVFKGDLYFGMLSDAGGNGQIRVRASSSGGYNVAGAFICASNALGSGYVSLIVNNDGSKMYAFERQFAAGTYKIVSTTDGGSGATRVVEYDVGVNVGATYTVSGYPTFDSNGDLYWPVFDSNGATHYLSQTLKRTAAGVWSIVDNANYHGSGALSRISF